MPFLFHKQLDAMPACQPRLVYLPLGMVNRKGRGCAFLDKASILSDKINKNQIFRNKEINALDFGRIIIFNDGHYCTNNLLPPLGNVENDDIRQILNNCISSQNSTWFLTRNNIPKCKDCIYNQLCPPVSDYEHVIGKFNLCNIL